MNTNSGPEHQPDPPSSDDGAFLIRIEPIVAKADAMRDRIQRDFPSHRGLSRAAAGVAHVAREARRVSARLKKPIGLHRLPAIFLLLALAGFLLILYFEFFHGSTIRIAVSSRDAVQLKQNLDRRVQFAKSTTVGSAESLALLDRGEVDMAFVQGGVPIPERTDGPDWIVREIPGEELILFFVKENLAVGDIRRILTSSENQGSHSLCKTFAECWGITGQVSYRHGWRTMTTDASYQVPDDVDAIFVVKDPLNSRLSRIPARLQEAGYRLHSPYIGAYGLRFPFLDESTIPTGFLDPSNTIPDVETPTYLVSTYVVVNPDLSPRQLAVAGRLVQESGDPLETQAFEPSFGTTFDILEGVEAGLGIIIYIVLAFLALLGIDTYFYRRRFNELNSLVSLITLHQSSKDALDGDPRQRAADVEYLRTCSDLLGLIGVVTGYYTQENATLMHNRLLEIIHERASSLKLNIQLKILHAQIDLPPHESGSLS